MDKHRVILSSKKTKNKVDENISFGIKFEQSNRPLPTEELVEVVDIGGIFQNERNLIQNYRFLGNINILSTNVLFNWNGNNSYANVLQKMKFQVETNSYEFKQNEVLYEDNGWFYYLTGGTVETSCDRSYLEPLQDRFSLYNINGDQNWNLLLTYPAKSNIKSLAFNGVPIEKGIALYSGTTLIIDDRIMTAFICSINHGLDVGSVIEIASDITTGYDGTHTIYQLGFGDGTYLGNVFIIDVDLGFPPSFINSGLRFKRKVQGVLSHYHGRWFKKLSKLREVETYNTAFATNIYKDQIYSYNFNKDYDLSNIYDYLDRPLTEAYITLIKKQDISNNKPFWTLVESGLKTSLETSEYDINTITTATTGDSIEDDVNNNNDLIFGDIVDYNPIDQTENILEVAYHRFNTINRENNNFLEGYYYKPHYKMQIAKFSDYVEESFSGDSNFPSYATVFPDGRVTWRDILPNDFTNETTIPFLNGCHYIYKSINLLVQRQDPCNVFNLGNPNFVLGDCDTIEQFEEVNPTNICVDETPLFSISDLEKFSPLNFLPF